MTDGQTHHAIVDERGKDVHQEDGQHHSFGVAFVDDADDDGEDTDEYTIYIFTCVGVGGGDGVGGHKDGAEEETAHQQMLPTAKRRESAEMEGDSGKPTAGDDGEHNLPTRRLRE